LGQLVSPFREENPNVVKLCDKYKAKGFEIFSVSLDDNRDAWTKAINDDKLLWTHVSDLMKWNSACGETNSALKAFLSPFC
jgi:hypothetical protein